MQCVEWYIINGICNGCDICPTKCYEQGYCEYDGKEQENEG